ncbi:MAG TPA: hypothetical protein DEO59_05695 [Balneola sp.]|jgi:Cu(I)/Ag(I) efflux system membrane fusion protein|nr:hypothetical protein [Balneola sp.]MAO78853.1 hypothetical protein [Balneola sp.]MBF63512.1 hypothetical protein [Balneola sp.]HAW79942.1 hypothetical protein [Balneola sp.]HBZ37975.1 hypothetical protein [Balneola sp.]|tara:strand:+ start:677 stop:1192 length:516 start_codon:yes stop_codon:yes gene_type:complete
MKYFKITLLALLLSSGAIQAQEKNKQSHDKHLGILITEYIQLKDALVADDFELAQKSLNSFSKEINSNSEMIDHESSDKYDAHHKRMVAAVNTTMKAQDIKALRDSFDEITDELLVAIENQGYTDNKLYVQFCPMANDKSGAKWLSTKEEILNPYYGSMMIKCGTTLKTIN